MTTLTGSLADPEFRRERARKAALARTTIDAHIAAIEKDADNLTTQQRDRLAEVVRPRVKREPNGIPHITGQRTFGLRVNGAYV